MKQTFENQEIWEILELRITKKAIYAKIRIGHGDPVEVFALRFD